MQTFIFFQNGVDSAGNEARLRRKFRKAIRVDKFTIMYFSSAYPREDIGLYVWNVATLLGIGLMYDDVICLKFTPKPRLHDIFLDPLPPSCCCSRGILCILVPWEFVLLKMYKSAL